MQGMTHKLFYQEEMMKNMRKILEPLTNEKVVKVVDQYNDDVMILSE